MAKAKSVNMLTTENVRRVHSLLSYANNTNNIHIEELSKELDVKKSELAAFILDNKKCFTINSKEDGLYIEAVYNAPDENPNNDEWLDKRRIDYKNTLYVTQLVNNSFIYYCVKMDKYDEYCEKSKTYETKYCLWRNTQEKINRFINTNHYHTGELHQFGDAPIIINVPYCLSNDEMIALINEGWTLDGNIPKNITDYHKKVKVKK